MARRFPDGPSPARLGHRGPAKAGHCVLILVLALSAGCGQKSSDEEGAAPEVPTITADTGTVGRKTLTEELLVRGTVTALPNQDVRVSALVAGRINSVTAAEGDAVKQGQVMATLDRRPLEDLRRQAAAAVTQARAQVENARLNLERNQQLFDRGIAAGKEVEDAKTQMASAQSALEQATAGLNTAALQLDRADVRSPINGQVVKRLMSVGEQVDGTAAQPIVEIANVDRVEIAANVPADQLSRIVVGQTAVVSTEGSSARTFSGTVLAIAPSVDVTTNAGLVRIHIPNPEGQLKVGMFVEARVEYGRHNDALVVPPAAVVKSASGAAVYVVTGDTTERTAVTLGLERPDAVEILTGLKEGQKVLTSSVYGLGEKANLAKPEEASKPAAEKPGAQKPDKQ